MTINTFTEEIEAINRELDKEVLIIDKNTQPLHYAHYLVNKALNPGKDRQSMRAAIYSGTSGETVDNHDLSEALGYKVKPISPRHIIDLFEGPDLSDWSDGDVLKYIKDRIGGKPGISLKRIKDMRAEGFLNRRVFTHIHRKLK